MKRLLTPALLVTSLLLTGCGRNNIRYEPPVFPVEREACFEILGDGLLFNTAQDLYVVPSGKDADRARPSRGTGHRPYGTTLCTTTT